MKTITVLQVVKCIPVKKLFLAMSLCIISYSAGFSQVVYTDLSPDVTITGWNVYIFHFAEADSTVGLSDTGTFHLWLHPFPDMQLNCLDINSEVMIADTANSFPYALNANDSISTSQALWLNPSYVDLNDGGSGGNWVGVKDKYLGLRFKMNGNTHYGWARLDVNAIPDTFTIKDYAYESTPGLGILAGDTTGDTTTPNYLTKRIDEKYNILVSTTGSSLFVHIGILSIPNTTLTIYNILGCPIATYSIHNENTRIDLPLITKGICFLKILHQDSIFTEKILFR